VDDLGGCLITGTQTPPGRGPLQLSVAAGRSAYASAKEGASYAAFVSALPALFIDFGGAKSGKSCSIFDKIDETWTGGGEMSK
jgi:hypothetical protein